MKISLDFDGCLANTMQSWLDKWNYDHHSHICYNDIQQWDFHNIMGISNNVFFEYLREAWSDWENLRPMESNLKDKIGKLKDGNEVDIVTSVSPSHIENVYKWVDKWEIPCRKIVNTDDKLSLDYDLYIDDRPGLFEDLFKFNLENIEKGKVKKGIIYHQPWNARNVRTLFSRVDRAYSWDDILKWI